MINVSDLAARIKGGYKISAAEALELAETTDKKELYAAADELRLHFRGNHFGTCSIINARSGRCSEDCKWCSQSHAHHTGVKEYPLIGAQEAVEMAVHNAQKGVERFSLVTSGRTMTDRDIDAACRIYEEIKKNTGIGLCASMGLLKKEQLQRLAALGLKNYHCNIETAPSHFGTLCTTHTIEDKLRTIRWAQEAGLHVCSGGIIGMGETMAQRVEMALFLRDEVKAVSIPINILMPIKGTKLENQPALSTEEILTTFAIFRFCNPEAEIRTAGGRVSIKDCLKEAYAAGLDASIVGDMLTTTGSCGIDDDMRLFRECGRTVGAE